MKNDALTKEETAQMDDMRKNDAPITPEPVDTPATEETVTTETPPTAKETKTDEGDSDQDTRRRVPLSELQEERKKRQKAEENARQREIDFAKAEERMRLIDEAIAAKNRPAPKPVVDIDPDKDPLGALKATADEVKEFRRFREQQAQAQTVREKVQNVISQAANLETAFASTTPDYNDASNFLKQSRAGELKELGMNDMQIQAHIYNESLQLADAAMRQGKNPAEVVYSLARSRGYAKAAPKTAADAKTVTDAEKISMIKQGQEANISLSNASGSSASSNPLTAKQLASMSDKEFSKVLSGLSKEQQHNYFGN